MCKKRQMVYVLEGFTWEPEHQYPHFLSNMVFKDYKKAYAEIERLKESILEEAEEMDWKVKIEWKSDFNTLEVKYPDGTIDNYVLVYREVIK